MDQSNNAAMRMLAAAKMLNIMSPSELHSSRVSLTVRSGVHSIECSLGDVVRFAYLIRGGLSERLKSHVRGFNSLRSKVEDEP